MSKKIFLPNADQSRELIENAWNDFHGKLEANNMDSRDKMVTNFIKEIFVVGYSYGHNDCLDVIRSQMEVDSIK